MKILVLNCGSSSLKYQLFNAEDESVLAKGLVERIGIEGSKLTHKPTGKDNLVIEQPMKDHEIAVKLVLDALMDDNAGVISDVSEIVAVGHRVVHGGQHYSDSIIVDEEAKKVIKECFDFAPLHNPANLIGVEACEAAMPGVPNVAVFDTAFHGTMPAKAYMYAVPREYYEKYGVRRYGFHGTSHSFVSKKTIEVAGLDKDNSKVVVCHLGNGASISAVVNGKCIDTSMGLTPLEGIIMGTRSGDVDPGVIEFIAGKENKDIRGMIAMLNKESGVYGLSGGISSDFRDLKAAMDNGDEKAIETIEAYTYKVAKYIGSYVAAMNGVDAIAFTAGVGENSPYIRTMICEYLGYLGIKLDEEANAKAMGEEMIITTADSKVKVCTIPTNEELAIVRETVALIK
ncbi:MAG: acetate kinase [Lachnospiraceae bacterium]|nr:acetate kinase [Lachnospiraceae bacterium]